MQQRITYFTSEQNFVVDSHHKVHIISATPTTNTADVCGLGIGDNQGLQHTPSVGMRMGEEVR